MSPEKPHNFKDDDYYEEDQENCCDSPKITEQDGFYVCLNCGYVFSRILDTSPRRAFTAEEIQKRKKYSCKNKQRH